MQLITRRALEGFACQVAAAVHDDLHAVRAIVEQRSNSSGDQGKPPFPAGTLDDLVNLRGDAMAVNIPEGGNVPEEPRFLAIVEGFPQ